MTPEHIRRWAPYVLGAGAGAYGLIRGQMAWIAMAAGFLGLPGFTQGTGADDED